MAKGSNAEGTGLAPGLALGLTPGLRPVAEEKGVLVVAPPVADIVVVWALVLSLLATLALTCDDCCDDGSCFTRNSSSRFTSTALWRAACAIACAFFFPCNRSGKVSS